MFKRMGFSHGCRGCSARALQITSARYRQPIVLVTSTIEHKDSQNK